MRFSAFWILKAPYALSVSSNIRKTIVCCTSTRYFAIESSLPVLTMFTKVSQGPFDDDGHFQVIWRLGNFPASRGSSLFSPVSEHQEKSLCQQGTGKLAKLQYFLGKSWKAAFLQDYFKRVLKTKRWNIECSNLPLKSEYVQQGTVMIFSEEFRVHFTSLGSLPPL